MDDNNPESSTLVTLPLSRENFKDFMASLLGKPESVQGSVEGAFEIDFRGFEQLDYRIDNRIRQQNKSEFIQFTAKLFFDDDSSRSFSGVKSFKEYKEEKNLICTGFIFTWIYLVEFNDKGFFEKQEISVSSVRYDISYSVRHTNQTWGVEIAELIRKYIMGFVKTDVPLAGFRRKVIENIKGYNTFFLILAFLLSFVFLWIYLQERLTSCRSFSDQIGQFVGENILLGEKVDFLINFFNTCQAMALKENVIFLLFTFFSLIISSLLSGWISGLIYGLIKLPTYRFLLFTEASEKEKEKYFSRVSFWRNFWLVTVALGSIPAFLNRILWNYISEWWGYIFG